jgi:hypothetical protein
MYIKLTILMRIYIYKCGLPVHVCAGHVLLSKCKDCAHVCVYTMRMLVLI